MTIDRRLPCELISLILSQLNKKKDLYACTLVNHVFYKEATPLLWRHLDIGNVPTFTSITAALKQQQQQQHGQLALLGTFVRSIVIIKSYMSAKDSRCFALATFSDDDLLALIQHVPFLTDLILQDGRHITDRSFEHVPQYIPHLTHLYLGHSQITQRSMEAMVRHWHPHLTRLELEYCHNLDADLFSALVPCTALQHLAITRCHLDAMNDPHIAPSAARHVLALTNLTTLRIQDWTSDYTSLVTAAAAAAGGWPQLTHICLDACLEMTDDMAIAFLQSHPHLTYLELRTSKITDKTLDAIPMYLPDVVEVRLNSNPGITPDGLRRLLRTCQHLELVMCLGCGILKEHFPERDEGAMVIDCDYDAEENIEGPL
ncbi:hypothetical protein BCR42DRAFT_496627 [Absidia repens]|uniref:F-box domain-containing protein n=1 Tax=Absidia repens TaxID=90262 RepID=A0A1X2HYU7_9FUNG|nr:hypothetical protein BCR42DRAFT_496627 [Absidia repens]